MRMEMKPRKEGCWLVQNFPGAKARTGELFLGPSIWQELGLLAPPPHPCPNASWEVGMEESKLEGLIAVNSTKPCLV